MWPSIIVSLSWFHPREVSGYPGKFIPLQHRYSRDRNYLTKTEKIHGDKNKKQQEQERCTGDKKGETDKKNVTRDEEDV